MGSDSIIVQCPKCGAKNRVPSERWGNAATCGKCRTPLVLSKTYPDRPVHVSDGTFPAEVLDHPGPVLIEFSAAW
jgi:RNase P subunit RPR2